jgi:2-oxoacid:acceptor oxidoreductase gamma subunit (pyruvate/2-ketoisovalerate family)
LNAAHDAAESLREKLARRESVDLRGHGKAGGGLILAVQSFGSAVAMHGDLDVQDWPLFSSARKGANVCAYLRIARGEVTMTCQVTRPDVALLMNEAAADEVDFAEGTDAGLYIVNTPDPPEVAARRHRLGGTIATIAGDDLGREYLGRPLANVAVLAALVRTTGLVAPEATRASLEKTLAKRRLPARLIAANLSLFDHAFDRVRVCEAAPGPETRHASKVFGGYGALPAGAQSRLRSSRQNHTAGYGRPGVRVDFADPTSRCNGCSLCVVQCPEGIIDFTPDPARGAVVHGARFADYCKVCRECIAACPLDLFHEVASVARPAGALEEG